MLSMLLAVAKRFPHFKAEGFRAGDNPVILCGQQAHYSIKKSCFQLGIGMNNIVAIKTNISGQILINELEATLEELEDQNRNPFYLCGLAGTTVTGDFDDFNELARICQQHSNSCFFFIILHKN